MAALGSRSATAGTPAGLGRPPSQPTTQSAIGQTSQAPTATAPAPFGEQAFAAGAGLQKPAVDAPAPSTKPNRYGNGKKSDPQSSVGYWSAQAQANAKACEAVAKNPKAQANGLAAKCKDSGGGPIALAGVADLGCPAPGSILQSYDAAPHVAMSDPFLLPNGAALTLWTETLAPLGPPLSGSVPDTVLYLLRCDDWSCAHGTIMAVDDDGNPSDAPFDSKLHVDNLDAGTYRWVVTGYATGNAGSCTVSGQQDNGPTFSRPTTVFGGMHHIAQGLAPGDALLVGKNDNTAALIDPAVTPPHMALQDNPEYADTVVIAFSTTAQYCAGQCGEFWFNDDAWWFSDRVFLSRLPLPAAGQFASTARVVVGTYHEWHQVGENQYPQTANVRLMHVRRHVNDGGQWSCTEQRDTDGDQLPYELEALLGSCDSANDSGSVDIGARGQSCAAWAELVNEQVNYWQPGTNCATNPPTTLPNQPNCWSARDSDNDGISDLWELHAAAASFANFPAPPAGTAGAPTSLSIHSPTPYCPGNWCSGYDVSALSDPSPATFDIYFQLDAVRCTGSHCSADYQPGDTWDHGLTDHQHDVLRKVFTEKSGSCWDGSTAWPCPREIDPTKDLLYRVSYHGYSLPNAPLPSSKRRAELRPTGVNDTWPWFNHSFRRPWKFLRLFHYAFLDDGTGGQSEIFGGRCATMGNTWTTVAAQQDLAQRVVAHESGHRLTLNHPHDNWIGPAAGPNQGPDNSPLPPGQCTGGLCPNDSTCQCDPLSFTCANEQVNNTESNKPNNPAAPTLMNYRYLWGMLPPGTTVPTAANPTLPGCSSCLVAEAQFSKGLFEPLAESALREVNQVLWSSPNGAEAWRQIAFVRALQCYNHAGDSVPGSGQNSDCGPFGLGTTHGPTCDAADTPTVCKYDFNYDDTYSSNGVTFDLSRGPFDNTGVCAADQLRDVNEWGRMVSLSRQNLRQEAKAGYAIYIDPFNGSPVPTNYAGWPDAITTQNLAIDHGEYRRNQCAVNADCPASNNCRLDSCNDATQCRTQKPCVGNVCTCNTDADCWSDSCVAGKCVVGRGICGCDIANPAIQCSGVAAPPPPEDLACKLGSNPAIPACAPDRTSAVLPAIGSDWKMWESARFGTGESPSWLRISGAPGTALSSLQFQDEFRVHLDFWWDGLPVANTSQPLFEIEGITKLQIEVDGQGVARLVGRLVHAQANQFTPVTYPTPIERRRWYRVTWAATKWGTATVNNPQWLEVWPRALYTGWFEPNTGYGCVYQSTAPALDLPATTEARFGALAASPTTFFRGRIDNIVFYNHTYGYSLPSNCVAQMGGMP